MYETSWTPPDEYWILEAGGTRYHIVPQVITKLEDELVGLSSTYPKCWKTFSFIDIFGVENCIMFDAINGWWECTPESRARGRAVEKMHKEEEGFEI